MVWKIKKSSRNNKSRTTISLRDAQEKKKGPELLYSRIPARFFFSRSYSALFSSSYSFRDGHHRQEERCSWFIRFFFGQLEATAAPLGSSNLRCA